MPILTENVWRGCYDDSWRGMIVDEAFAHPAKMSRGLVVRIFGHAFERGWLKRGDVVVDPFGGIGSTGIEAASRGFRAFLCELEPRFVALAEKNFEIHRRVWDACGDPLPVIVQGDSRNLCDVLKFSCGLEPAGVCVSSPPYSESTVHGGGHGIDWTKAADPKAGRKRSTARDGLGEGYAESDQTPGQLGGMPPGSVSAVIGSPPFLGEQTCGGIAVHNGTHGNIKTGANCGYQNQASSEGNLAALPPGTLADLVCSSPPFSKDHPSQVKLKAGWEGKGGDGFLHAQGFAKTDGNIASEQGETFWAAARQIVAQCYQILRPGGHAIWVCKDFVRKGERVPFSADWLKLCEACDFTPVEWIKASLVKEDRHAGLFGEDVVKTKSRKSFFRRLAEAKGSPAIDHEDVLIVRRPVTGIDRIS